ncbi:MAG: hypothetical protein R3A52_26660 [Polyangiales bacterium]
MRATVRNGRLVMDEPTSMPEGTVLSLVVDDEGDDLDEAEREALHRSIARSWESLQAGQGRDATDLLAELRSRR